MFIGGALLSGVATSCSSKTSESDRTSERAKNSNLASSGPKTIRLGYQKSAAILNLLKNKRQLEERFESQEATVEWSEFTAGPQMLEALNVGSIDIAYTGETPPVFAQAAGAPLLYVAYEPVGTNAEAILVQKDSPIQRVSDLKGKKIALNKGSNVHYLLVKALEEAGPTYSDIEAVYLPPGDARLAFEQNGVDAWVIWDPFQAGVEKSLNARILRDGKGLVENRGFYLATQSFAQNQPGLLKDLLDELKSSNAWAQRNKSEVAQFLSSELGLPKEVLELSEGRRGYGISPISEDVVAYSNPT